MFGWLPPHYMGNGYVLLWADLDKWAVPRSADRPGIVYRYS